MSAVLKEQETRIVEFDEFEAKLIEFKKKYDNVVYDLTIPEQDKQARSDRYSIGTIVSALDSKHKELKAPLKAQVDLIDGRRKEIKDELLGVQGKIKGQIDAHDQAIKEHAEMLQLRVDEIIALAEFDGEPNSGTISRRLEAIKIYDIDDSYEDRKADATLAHVDVIKKLNLMLAKAVTDEQEKAELETLRKEKEDRERAEREEQIREEAFKKATKEAEEKAANEKAEAEAKAQKEIDDANKKQAEAEQARKDAIENAKREKEESELAIKRAEEETRAKLKLEREQKEAKEKAAREKEDAKKAKQAHRCIVHGEAKDSFIDNGFCEKDAEKIVCLIKDGQIKNIQVNY